MVIKKTLVIYAHPNTGGHCATILKEVESTLKSRKQDFEIVDLYKLKYDPVLHEAEHYTRGKKKISAENKKFQKKIMDSDKLIFIYPVWWGSMPAILKGFFDRVFTSHFAFRYEGSMPKPLLKGKKAAIFVTFGGPKVVSKIFSCAGKLVRMNILWFCGIKSKTFALYSATELSEKNKARIQGIVPKGLAWLYR